jgi:hypothetical protein
MLLTAGGWVEATLVEDDQVLSVLLEYVVEYSNNVRIKIHTMAVSVVEIHGFWQVDCVVEHSFSSLSNTFLSGRNFIVQVSGDW